MKSRRKAYLSLRFVIVGGSIAGLACAYALREAGHQVLVLEQSDGKARVSTVRRSPSFPHLSVQKSHGAIRSPPNMTRIFNQWGVGGALAKIGVKCTEFTFRQGDTTFAMVPGRPLTFCANCRRNRGKTRTSEASRAASPRSHGRLPLCAGMSRLLDVNVGSSFVEP